ncbi:MULTISPECIES: hypothetical protein [Priestia]|uniref:hypothetical protein n=1 Tax=Priestia TaxID=2800373 RepID=UPI00088698AE|nr:hypothetical protein [Priestia megaterium]MED4256776.1 hypothetical protein [Priestia megaterium]SDE78015.1 hypothetical protein SAMN04487777_12629 [Priestia aryabhattai B8W22]
MSIHKFDKSVVIEEKTLTSRRDQFYKIIHDIVDEEDLELMLITTLHSIAFCDYLLGTEVEDNKRLNSLINIVNDKRNTTYNLLDFHVHF